MEISGDNEDCEFPVDLLIEVRVPCLVCGVDVEIDNIVKQEVGEDDAKVYFGGQGDNVDHEVFHWFLKWFRVDIVKKGKQRLVDRGWDGHGGDILRFCANCKMELIGLLELQRQLDELEQKIKNGLGEVKRNMESFEGTFQVNGIYERDDRYRRVRSRIVKCVAGKSKHSTSDNYGLSSRLPDDPTRRSSRRVTNFLEESEGLNSATANITSDAEFSEARVPVVMVLPLEKAGADQYLIPDLPDVKPDISLIPTSSSETPILTSPVKKFRKPLRKKKVVSSQITKLKKKSKPTKKPSSRVSQGSSQPPKENNLDDDSNSNYFEDELPDNPSDPDFDPEDKKASIPQPNRRKVKDEDFNLDDDDNEQDPLSSDDDIEWTSKIEGKTRRKLTFDPSTNMFTFGTTTFSMSPDQPNKVTCTSCNITMKNKRDCMRCHITKYHTNRFACPHCPFKTVGTNVLETHIQSVHQGLQVNRKFPCKICGKPISKRKNHEWTHMSKEEQDEIMKNEPDRLPEWLRKKFQCDECGKGFKGAAELKRHLEKIHEGKGQEKARELCPKCGKTVADLKPHLRYTHGNTRNFECTEQGCGKRFKKLNLLTRHKETMHRGKRWKCTMCTREFAWKECLSRHMNLHLGIRPWKCEVEGCGGAFATKGNLRKHHKCFHEEGSKPRRKCYQRGPTVLGVGFRKEDLVRKGTYYPPSALNSWAKGRIPGHLMEEKE